MAKVANVTNLQCLLRNDRLDCYYIQVKLTLRCSLDSVVRMARPTMFLGVSIYFYFFFFWAGGGGGELLKNVDISNAGINLKKSEKEEGFKDSLKCDIL